jgi:DNA-directed RNA polymerase subunit RPC12/RpoP
MDLEIQFLLNNCTERNPRLLVEHIQRMVSGEASFLPTMLSLVYDKLIAKVFMGSTTTNSGTRKPTETGGQSGVEHALATQASNSTIGVDISPTPGPLPSTQQAEPVPELVPLGAVWLTCFKCGEHARLRDLYDGTRCPRCPLRSVRKGRPYMQCSSCNRMRLKPGGYCLRNACQAIFV